MHYYQNVPVHQYSPIKTVPYVTPVPTQTLYQQPITQIYQTSSQIKPTTAFSNVRYPSNVQNLKGSALSTFQPYKPDPEVEKIISKYTKTERSSQIEQPITHQPSNSINQNTQNQMKYQNDDIDDDFKDMQYTQNNKNNNIPSHFQFDEIKQRQQQYDNKNFSPEVNEFQDFSPPKQKMMVPPQQNDKIVKLIVSGIIVLLIIYIISILVLQ